MINNVFLGRNNELNKLKSKKKKKGLLACLIYGRRRIGKSELIKHAIRETKDTTIYYEAKQTTEQNNLDSITELICETLNVSKVHFRSIEEAFEYLF